eukprot:GHVN01091729.1.p1 GENE.GHVN01091729.1~~GHVN01091729.1.p1  ORF type:complete len:888 (+),score=267.45 GHVN01091729.1:3-2666(+)
MESLWQASVSMEDGEIEETCCGSMSIGPCGSVPLSIANNPIIHSVHSTHSHYSTGLSTTHPMPAAHQHPHHSHHHPHHSTYQHSHPQQIHIYTPTAPPPPATPPPQHSHLYHAHPPSSTTRPLNPHQCYLGQAEDYTHAPHSPHHTSQTPHTHSSTWVNETSHTQPSPSPHIHQPRRPPSMQTTSPHGHQYTPPSRPSHHSTTTRPQPSHYHKPQPLSQRHTLSSHLDHRTAPHSHRQLPSTGLSNHTSPARPAPLSTPSSQQPCSHIAPRRLNQTPTPSASPPTSAAPPKQPTICDMCEVSASKYQCPACEYRTCSKLCCIEHKQKTGCTGRRRAFNPTPRTVSAFDDQIIARDVAFLDTTSRLVESSARMRCQLYEDTRYLIGNPQRVGARHLRGVAAAKGVWLRTCPVELMGVRRRNTSKVVAMGRKKTAVKLLWRVEFIIVYFEEDDELSTDVSDVNDVIEDEVMNDKDGQVEGARGDVTEVKGGEREVKEAKRSNVLMRGQCGDGVMVRGESCLASSVSQCLIEVVKLRQMSHLKQPNEQKKSEVMMIDVDPRDSDILSSAIRVEMVNELFEGSDGIEVSEVKEVSEVIEVKQASEVSVGKDVSEGGGEVEVGGEVSFNEGKTDDASTGVSAPEVRKKNKRKRKRALSKNGCIAEPHNDNGGVAVGDGEDNPPKSTKRCDDTQDAGKREGGKGGGGAVEGGTGSEVVDVRRIQMGSETAVEVTVGCRRVNEETLIGHILMRSLTLSETCGESVLDGQGKCVKADSRGVEWEAHKQAQSVVARISQRDISEYLILLQDIPQHHNTLNRNNKRVPIDLDDSDSDDNNSSDEDTTSDRLPSVHKKRYFRIPPTLSLKEALRSRIVVEFPVFKLISLKRSGASPCR